MNVGSLFSGIGGIDLGLERASMRVLWQCEADPWRRDVLRRHWPDAPCYEDVARVSAEPAQRGTRNESGRRVAFAAGDEAAELPSVDLLCGGFPCQDLSVAGKRAGLGGARSSLFFEFARVAQSLRPRWLLVENVPGLLSSNGGRDFAVLLATLAELGYGVCWRVLDSRFFGVPQRRRRVFIVGHLGAASAAPFLPFLEGGEGHPAASGEAGPATSVASPLSSPDGGWRIDAESAASHLIAPTLTAQMAQGDPPDQVAYIAAPLSHGSNPNSNAAGRRREDDENLVASFDWQQGSRDVALTPYAEHYRTDGQPAILSDSAVRRLTPTECCRLQGFPDDWLGPENEPPDSPRYAALGDAVTVNVAEWIGRRILEAEELKEVA